MAETNRDDLSNEQIILEYLYDYGEKCGDNCGKRYVEIHLDTAIHSQEVKDILNRLYKAKKVIYRDGAQGLLFFYNYKTDPLGKAVDKPVDEKEMGEGNLEK